jgi:hypothetical protein
MLIILTAGAMAKTSAQIQLNPSSNRAFPVVYLIWTSLYSIAQIVLI